jgi:hypothetical protein
MLNSEASARRGRAGDDHHPDSAAGQKVYPLASGARSETGGERSYKAESRRTGLRATRKIVSNLPAFFHRYRQQCTNSDTVGLMLQRPIIS